MKIKSLFFMSALCLGVFCLTSCEEGTNGEDGGDLESIYWNKSAAFQMQLKGKVKTVVVDTITTISFNESGNIISEITDNNGFINKNLLTYSNGRLVRNIYSSGYGEHGYSDTTNITYGTWGKYLPTNSNDAIDMKLIRNVAGIKSNHSSTRFVSSGDSILMITSNENLYNSKRKAEMGYADTTSLTFNGGLYPVSMKRGNRVCTITYASDGRFLTIDDKYVDFYQTNSTVTTFKSDSKYLLPVSIVRKQGNEAYSTETYEFNENDDIISKDGQSYDEEYSDYVYDAKGNWTSRNYRSKESAGEWSPKRKQTRTITYWD